MTTTEQDQHTIAELARHNGDLTHDLFAAEQRAKAAEAERDRYHELLKTRTGQANTLGAEAIRLTQQLADRDATIRTQGEEIERLRELRLTEHEQYMDWLAQRDRAQREADRLRAQVATLEAEVADLTKARRLAEYDRLRQRP